jgi:hypothetical protein
MILLTFDLSTVLWYKVLKVSTTESTSTLMVKAGIMSEFYQQFFRSQHATIMHLTYVHEAQ